MNDKRFGKFVIDNTIIDESSKHYNFKQDVERMGTKALTTRQPPRIHAMIDMMSAYLPTSSKGEIIYESVLMAFKEFESRIKATHSHLNDVVDSHYIGPNEPMSAEEEAENTVIVTKFDEYYTEFFAAHDSSQLDLHKKSNSYDKDAE